jgi:polyisoprenyl-teichoic acid--peptidoglycan teichoic acid transferase
VATLPQRPPTRPRPPLVAAALSFIWPGLGQWYLGQPRRALLYGAPVLLLAIVLAVQLGAGLTVFAARLLDPAFSSIVLVGLVVLAAWRLLAILDAARSRDRRQALNGRSAVVLTALIAAVLATNGVVAYYAWSFYEAGSQIFVGSGASGGTGSTTTPSQIPASATLPTPTDDYNVGPFETPATAASRITVLFTGIDKTTTRDHSLNDTLLVVSVDPTTHKVVMVSFPRDLAGFPLFSGGTYAGKINSLMSYAAAHPDRFPDGPLPTLAKELTFLLGVPINYFAAIDIDGFQRMIEAVGPITIDVPQAVNDPTYGFQDGSVGFSISPGVHVLDTRLALAYVQSRHGDSDYSRAARQQQVLLALRAKLTDPAMIGNIPGLLTVAGQTIRTNFPVERLSEMLVLAQGLGTASTQQFVLKPPTYSVHPPMSTTGGTWLLRIRWNAVRQLSVDMFGSSSAFWTGQFTASGSPIAKQAP